MDSICQFIFLIYVIQLRSTNALFLFDIEFNIVYHRV